MSETSVDNNTTIATMALGGKSVSKFKVDRLRFSEVLHYFMVELLLFGSVTGTTTLTAENGGGFSVTRFPTLNLFSIQCNGSHLPSDVRTVQHISLKKETPGVPAYTIASLSPSDGVRLENSHKGHYNTYVNGIYDVDNLQSTSLTILMSDVADIDVTYRCNIAYTDRHGNLVTKERTLNITALDIQNMYSVDTTGAEETPEEEVGGVAAPTQSHETKPYWNTPMILLIAMASLLFILFIVCILLVIDRCKENRRQRKRSERSMKKKGGNPKEIPAMDQDNRPLPPPPTWTYPPGTAVPPYKSPYHRLKVGAGVRSFADDTGYDSDASMIYCRPYDDVGEVIAEKTALETFGKHLPPMYTHDRVLGNLS